MTKIDTSKWKEFIIGDLFEKLQLDIKNENFNKALDVSEEQNEEFNLPLVNAKHGNNGIMYYGRESDFDIAEMTIDIVQNGAIATGDVYDIPPRGENTLLAFFLPPLPMLRRAYFCPTKIRKHLHRPYTPENGIKWTSEAALNHHMGKSLFL